MMSLAKKKLEKKWKKWFKIEIITKTQQKYNTTKTRDTVVMGLSLWHCTRTSDTRDRDTTVLPKPVLCPTSQAPVVAIIAVIRN